MSGDTTDDKGTTDKDVTSGTGATDNKDTTSTDVDKDPTLKTDDVAGLKKALAAERKRAGDLEKAQRDAELAKLPELERAQTEAIQLKTENEKLTKENMRLSTALKLGLSWSLGKRLHGDTPEEMEADGAELLKQYNGGATHVVPDDPKNKRPPNDAKKTGSASKPGMNEILRALRKG